MAVHKFECGFTCRCGNRIHWEGTWERVCIENELVTVRVTGRGRSFDTVVAQREWGDFICIPSHDIGFSIGSFSDTARLEEHFRKNLGQEDAITVAAALKSMERESE